MKEWSEAVNWLGDMAVQAITLEPNQGALQSATEFFDELTEAPGAIQGLAENAAKEAAAAEVQEITGLFRAQYEKLINAGVDEKAAHLITSGIETAFTGYSLAAEKKQQQ